MSKRLPRDRGYHIGPIKMVNLPRDLYHQFQEALKRNGTDEGNFFSLQIRAYLKKSYGLTFNLGDIMPFGKYEGARIEDIIRGDLNYMMWLASESEKFVLADRAQQLMQKLLREREGAEDVPLQRN